MRVICSWCGRFMGEKEPFNDPSATHGRCLECLKAQKQSGDLVCPVHGCPLLKKRILYGYITPDYDSKKYIPGGCCVEDGAPTHGYECTQDGEAYILENGVLKPLWEEEEVEDDAT